MSRSGKFPGGILLPAHKHASSAIPIRTPPLPAELILALGVAAPLVAPGDSVRKGQVIAAPDRAGLPLHAPTSGRIAAIELRPVAQTLEALERCLVLVPDGDERWIERPVTRDPRQRTVSELLAAVRAAGIVGLGGGGFPTHIKLAPTQSIDTLVVNGMECEPYITADDRLMQEDAAAIVSGLRLAARILGDPARILIGIEDDKPEAVAHMNAALSAGGDGDGIEIMVLPSRYPAGGERQLIQLLTGRQVPSGGLPADIGVVCLNVGTLHALHRALVLDEPLLSRIVTVTGGACGQPANYRALLGTPLAHLLAASDYRPEQCARLLLGGPMMGTPLTNLQAPITKTTHCVLAVTAAELPPPRDPQPCIRCGLCADVCPASLLPQQLLRHAVARDRGQLERHHLFDCIECGACAYVCPSAIPLVDHYRVAKAEVNALRAERLAADHARRRFEAHQTRVTRQLGERSARHAELLGPSAVDANVPTSDPVIAAPAAVDLVEHARARAGAATPQRAQLERALSAAESRIAQLEAELAALDATATESRRNGLLARLAQARLDGDLARRRLHALPVESASSREGNPP
ncbi:MAG: electron transport complex subunit RsxC [Porticoccaceae bacterium]